MWLYNHGITSESLIWGGGGGWPAALPLQDLPRGLECVVCLQSLLAMVDCVHTFGASIGLFACLDIPSFKFFTEDFNPFLPLYAQIILKGLFLLTLLFFMTWVIAKIFLEKIPSVSSEFCIIFHHVPFCSLSKILSSMPQLPKAPKLTNK